MAGSVELHQFKYADFTDKKSLGDGEFGIVYSVKHPQFQRLAVRIISRRFFPRNDERNALQREAEQLFSIVSEHVVRLLGIVMEPEHLCLVFEYAEHGSLDKVLTRCKMRWPLKTRIAYEIALGMCFLHDKNILHLCLKCRNVLVTGSMQVKISDVSFTNPQEMNTWTRYAADYSQTVRAGRSRHVDTVHHIPPELINDINANPDKAADVYAYGIILWQILANNAPYEGKTPSDICTFVGSGNRPQVNLIPDNRPEVLFSLMTNCWSEIKEERPKFGRILELLKPAFNESEARNQGCECQKDIDPFSHNEGQTLRPPDGDMRRPVQHISIPPPSLQHTELPPPPQGQVPEPRATMRSDSKAFSSLEEAREPAATDEERVIPKLHAAPQGMLDQMSNMPPNGVFQPTQGAGSHSSNYSESGDPKTAAFPFNTSVSRDNGVSIPGENSSRHASTEDLYNVAERLGKNWRKFGRSLSFNDGALDNIEMSYARHGYPEIPYQMLRRWNDVSGPITVSYLVERLKSEGLLSVARSLNP